MAMRWQRILLVVQYRGRYNGADGDIGEPLGWSSRSGSDYGCQCGVQRSR